MNTQTRTDMMLSIHELHGKIYIRNKNKDIIAEILGSGHGDAMEYARLIAAAPDLLACCDAVLSAWHNKASDYYRKEPAYLEAIRIAINKATLNPESEA